MSSRFLELEGTWNFRDFGGYRTGGGQQVRRHRLYRSDNLSRLTAWEAFTRLGIRLLIDFRTPYERGCRPNRLPPNHSLRCEHLPISLAPEMERGWSRLDQMRFLVAGGARRYGPEFTTGVYRRLPENAAASLGRFFDLLQDPGNYPVLIHCMGGRDRTGFAAAMLLYALGVPLETILGDYHTAGPRAVRRMDEMVRRMRYLSLFRAGPEEIRGLLETRPGYLEAALESVRDKYGSVDAYLRERAGLTEERREMLRELLLGEADSLAAG